MTYSLLWQPALDRVTDMIVVETMRDMELNNIHFQMPIDAETVEKTIKEHIEWFIRSLNFEVDNKMASLTYRGLTMHEDDVVSEEEKKLLKRLQ